METTKENLKLALIEALKISKKFLLANRPEDVKFDETNPVIRNDIATFKDFFVGGLYKYRESKCAYTIVAFVEMVGKIKGIPGIRIKDIFCVLAIADETSSEPFHKRILTARVNGPIHLFGVKNLQNIKEE